MPSKFVQYDLYERHGALSLPLTETDSRRVLDVGGVEGLLASHLSGATVSTLNVDRTGDVQYGGRAIPFVTQAFHAVVSLDTMEHIRRPEGLYAEVVGSGG